MFKQRFWIIFLLLIVNLNASLHLVIFAVSGKYSKRQLEISPEAIETDINNVRKLFNKVSDILKINFFKYVYREQAATSQQLRELFCLETDRKNCPHNGFIFHDLDVVQSEQKGKGHIYPADIVVFYYTGHGISNTFEKPWPILLLHGENGAGKFPLRELINSLKQKRISSHLTIIIADCCNDFPSGKGGTIDVSSKLYAKFYQKEESELPLLSEDKILDLFVCHQGTIIMAGANKGESGYITPETVPVRCSIFTYVLYEMLILVISETTMDSNKWDYVLSQTSGLTKKIVQAFWTKQQTPIFENNAEYNPDFGKDFRELKLLAEKERILRKWVELEKQKAKVRTKFEDVKRDKASNKPKERQEKLRQLKIFFKLLTAKEAIIQKILDLIEKLAKVTTPSQRNVLKKELISFRNKLQIKQNQLLSLAQQSALLSEIILKK